MEKRLILAIALSLIVLISWSFIVPKPQHVATQDVVEKNIVSIENAVAIQELLISQSKNEPLVFKTDNFEVFFNKPLGAIEKIVFSKYKDHNFLLGKGFLINNKNIVFQKSEQKDKAIVFKYSGPDLNIEKKFTFHNSSYSIDLEITATNTSKQEVTLQMPLVIGNLDLSSKNPQTRFIDTALMNSETELYSNGHKNLSLPNIKFIGFRDQYFTALLSPVNFTAEGYINKESNQSSEIGVNVQNEKIAPGKQIGHLYKIYLGPQDVNLINSVNPDWAKIVRYGPRLLDFISQILLQTLKAIYGIVRNWGIAIILLSILVYLILYPLSLKQMRSMKEMQILQPKVEEIRKAYKDNPQKMNKEIMELYREHKVNPLGGCLPLLLQMPIFFALYNALIRSISLKGAGFLWIKDLSEPDKLYVFEKALPLLGKDLNILPIIMAIGMFFQQKISSSSMTGSAAEQQKIMFVVMPIMFGIIFYRMPSGLVLYWFVNSILMLIFQLRMQRSK